MESGESSAYQFDQSSHSLYLVLRVTCNMKCEMRAIIRFKKCRGLEELTGRSKVYMKFEEEAKKRRLRSTSNAAKLITSSSDCN